MKLTIRKPSSETVVVKELKTEVKTPSATATTATSISRAPAAAAPPTAPASMSVSIGEPVEVELDANADEDGPSQVVWAAATVSRVDEPLEQFYVSVTEWASLAEDDPDQEDAYEEGPYDAEGEGTWWRRLASARADRTPSSRPAAAADSAMDDAVSHAHMHARMHAYAHTHACMRMRVHGRTHTCAGAASAGRWRGAPAWYP